MIKDRPGRENAVVDHLSRIQTEDSHIINENVPDESILAIDCNPLPWYAHIINYLVACVTLDNWDYATRKKFFKGVKHYFYDELELFKLGADDTFLRRVPEEEQASILNSCHFSLCGGHYA